MLVFKGFILQRYTTAKGHDSSVKMNTDSDRYDYPSKNVCIKKVRYGTVTRQNYAWKIENHFSCFSASV